MEALSGYRVGELLLMEDEARLSRCKAWIASTVGSCFAGHLIHALHSGDRLKIRR